MRKYLSVAIVTSLVALAQMLAQADTRIATSVTAVSTQSPSPFGESIRWAATVNGGGGSFVPTGWVVFQEGDTVIGRQRLNRFGIAFYWTSLIPVGDHSIRAVYEGDANFAPSSVEFTQSVSAGDSAVELTASPATVAAWDAVALTASVGPVRSEGFTPSATIPFAEANGPTKLATIDFGDGRDSLLAAAPGQAGILSFQTVGLTELFGIRKVWSGAKMGTVDVAVGDITGDGHRDIATANALDGNIRVFPADPLSGFGEAAPYFAGFGLSALAAGDFDNDGSSDVAATLLQGRLVVFRSVAGELVEVYSRTLNSAPRQIVTGDFNEDGTLDLAIVCEDSFMILLNDGAGHFENGGAWLVPNKDDYTALAATDLNGDGHLDLAVAAANPAEVFLVKGTGTGQVSSIWILGVGGRPVAIAAADFNRDGLADLAIANANDHDVDVVLGNGNFGVKRQLRYGAGLSPVGIAASDFNGDGRTDIVVSNKISGDLTVLLNAYATGATGSVQFKDNGVNIGAPVPLDAQGHASTQFSPVTRGAHAITAEYSGDGNFLPSSGSADVLVEKGAPVMTLTTVGAPSVQDLIVTLSAPTAGETMPTGAVQFYVGGSPLGGPVSVDGSGNARTQAHLAAGTHVILAEYTGDADFIAASRSRTMTVEKLTPQVIFNISGPASAVKLSVEVSRASFTSVSPTGTIQFSEAGTLLGGPIALTGSRAELVLRLAPGPHTITASYSGDENFSAATAARSESVVSAPSTTKLTAFPASTTYGQGVRFTAEVSRGLGFGPFDGVVTFKVDGQPHGQPVPLNNESNSCCSTVSLTMADLPAGAHTITAEYGGDSRYEPSSASIDHTVAQASTLTAPGTSVNPALSGQHVTLTARVSPTGMRFSERLSVGFANGDGFGAATADFNEDGRLDVAIPASGSIVSLLPGDGAGGFAFPPKQFATAQHPRSILAGDVSGDGHADVVTASYVTNTVSVLLGDGSGTLGTPTTIGVSQPYAIGAADFNRDGVVDIAAASRATSSVAILLGTGAGAFAAPAYVGAGGTPEALTVGDFNGDGNPDVAVTHTQGRLAIMLGDGTGALAVPATIAVSGVPTKVVAADFTGDEVVDLAAVTYYNVSSSQTAITVAFVKGAGDGNFAAASTFLVATLPPTLPSDLIAADLNADGKLDVLVTSSGSRPWVLRGNGAGEFDGPEQPIPAQYGWNAGAGDLDGDGRTDVIFAAYAYAERFLNQSIAPPTGMVQFFDGGTALGGERPVSGGFATLTTSFDTVGAHQITARYLGDRNYSAGPSLGTINQLVKSNTQTKVTGPTSVAPGQTMTFTATVTPIDAPTGNPGGTVSLKWGATLLAGPVTLNSGAATFTFTKTFDVGTYQFTAEYTGDANFNASSGLILVTVQKFSTSTTVTTSATPSTIGQAVTFAATVKTSPASSETPAGSVQFKDNGTPVGTPVPLNGGVATVTTSALPAGFRTITAEYSPQDGRFSASSGGLMQEVRRIATSVTMTTSPAPSTFGEDVTIAIVVAPQSGSGTPTGTVRLVDGNTELGSPVPLVDGRAKVVWTKPGVGSHSFLVQYSGDDTYNGSGIINQRHQVNRARPAFSNLTSASVAYGTQTVTVSGVIGAGDLHPSGDVSVTGPSTQSVSIGPDGSFSAAFDTSALPASDSPYDIGYTWAGNGDFEAASATGTLRVTRRAASVTPDAAAKQYGDADPPLTGTTSGFLDRDLPALTVSYSRTPGEDVLGGPYPIRASLGAEQVASNYDITYNTAPFTITPARATIDVQGFSGTYDGRPHGATGTATGVKGENLSSLLTLQGSFVDAPGGSAQWTFTGNGNYQSASGTATVAIAPAPLTVTADDQAMIAGAGVPALTASYAGFVNGETPGVLDSPAVLSTTATSSSAVGQYPVVVTGATDRNYQIAFVNGTLTIDYNTCLLYDPLKVHKAGSTIPIGIQLCDAQRNNLSSAALTLHVTRIVRVGAETAGAPEDAGNANPDSDFRLVGPVASYMFNLQTKGLAAGTYNLEFIVNGNPRTYSVPLQVR